MKKLAALAIAAAFLAACGGHGGGSMPPMASAPQSASQMGMGTTKSAAVLQAPSGWSSTGTQAIPIANASDAGAANAAQSITVRVGLQLHNMKQLQAEIAAGNVLDDGTFMATYAPTSSDVSAVTTYLQSKGFSNISVAPNNLIVSADGSIAQVQTAFNTSIHSFSGGGTSFIANVAPAFVPQSLSGIVVAVLV